MPILAAKLFIPPLRHNFVRRPRLIDRLNQGLAAGCKLTLISASAGFGKTTLVSEWAAGCGRKVAWLSLDEEDNDLTRFLTYFIAALQTLALSKAEGLVLSNVEGLAADIGAGVADVLQSPQPPPVESLLTALINEITALPESFMLVLDDYHVIDSKEIDEALAFLLKHLPPQMHLVIITREDPHLPLARLRARGQLTELRAADLRFTPAEAAEFLNQVMGLNLSEEAVAALEARTEGWIAGMQLAALSMQGQQDTVAFIKSFTGSHHFVLDYLIEEVLQRQPEAIQTFLLRTSILERMCSSLCDAVLGCASPSGQETLEYLERTNLFIAPLDNDRRWYRYHHLFADVLRMHLMAEQPDQVSSLHRNASEWFEENGWMDYAIRHALAAADHTRAADLIELVFPAMSRNQQSATLLGWIKTLPGALVRLRPVLSTEYALVSIYGGELENVEPRLRDAERWLDTAADIREGAGTAAPGMVVVDEVEFRHLPGMIALTRGAVALGRGDVPEAVNYARKVLDLAPEDDHLRRGGAGSVLGIAAWANGDLDTARRMTADGLENVRLAGYVSAAIGGTIVLTDILIAQGCLHEAMTAYERGLQWATVPGRPTVRGAADMHVGMSALQYEHNDLKTSAQHLHASQALGELAGLQQNPYRWCAAMARIRAAEGDLDGALALLDQAERVYDGAFSPNVRPLSARKVRVWLAQGRLGDALGWVCAQGLSAENELSYLREFDHITLARVLLALYQSDHTDRPLQEARGLLERLLKAAQERGGKGSAIEILVLQALACHAQGDLPAALDPLQKALALAEPQGYMRMFIDEGASMIQLLCEAVARGIIPGYSASLLAAFEAEEPKNEGKPDLSPAQPLIEPLSQRELEVLHLIAQGLSNREIGERLFLALDTVKGHNRKIFDKLQVQNRTEAAARARKLGIL